MKNRKKGFTIVELVIVIAVIGILSAILIPTFAGVTRNAQEKALQEGLRNAYVAYSVDYAAEEGYVAEEDMYLSADASLDGNSVVYKLGENGVWVPATATEIEGLDALNGTLTDDAGQHLAYNGYYLYV